VRRSVFQRGNGHVLLIFMLDHSSISLLKRTLVLRSLLVFVQLFMVFYLMNDATGAPETVNSKKNSLLAREYHELHD